MALDEATGSRVSGSTSDGTCLIRAVAAQEPDPKLRCPDSLARAFVADLPVARLCDSKPGFRLARWITERRIPGAYWSEVARVKFFDERLLSEVAGGVSQVVILGAGLDSRAYRFKEELSEASVFEVDHPVTAARKLADRPTGSSIAFDYDFEAFTSGDDGFYGATATRRVVEGGGERLTLGLDPDGMQGFLERRRLNLESNLLPDQIADRYLRSSKGDLAGRPFGFIGMVHARSMSL